MGNLYMTMFFDKIYCTNIYYWTHSFFWYHNPMIQIGATTTRGKTKGKTMATQTANRRRILACAPIRERIAGLSTGNVHPAYGKAPYYRNPSRFVERVERELAGDEMETVTDLRDSLPPSHPIDSSIRIVRDVLNSEGYPVSRIVVYGYRMPETGNWEFSAYLA